MATLVPVVQMWAAGEKINIETDFRYLTYFESLYGSAVYSVKFQTPQWSVWDRVVMENQSVTSMRFGYQEGPDRYLTDPKIIRLDGAKLKYRREAVEVKLEGVDRGFTLVETQIPRVFKEMTISDMVRQIADATGFKDDVDKKTSEAGEIRQDIEETDGMFSFTQSLQSDAHFIRQRLLPVAYNAEGRGDYVFYIEDGKVLNFKTIDFGQEPFHSFHLVSTGLSVVSPEEPRLQLDELSVDFRRMEMAREGGLHTEFRGYDPFKKSMIKFIAKSDTVPFISLGDKIPPPSWQPDTLWVLNYPTPDIYDPSMVQKIGSALWSKAARGLFRTSITVEPMDIDAKPGKIVVLNVDDPKSGGAHFVSGRWLVYAVKHHMTTRRIKTTMFLERRSYV